jgi:hypothetical protein
MMSPIRSSTLLDRLGLPERRHVVEVLVARPGVEEDDRSSADRWPEDLSLRAVALDRLLPPYKQWQRRIGRWVRKVI